MNKPYLIGLTGASGSGKTTFLQSLKEEFAAEELCVISQDNYYHPREHQEADSQGVKNFDLPTSIDRDQFFIDIQKLLRNETVTRKEYTFNNAEKEAELLIFEPRPIIILEGIFVFYYTEIAKLLDLKVFLYAKETTALSRRIRRDQQERNYPLDDVLYRYENHVQPTYERYIKPFMNQADVIINNTQDFQNGLAVLKGFLHQKLIKG